jgi:hypothetical protein
MRFGSSGRSVLNHPEHIPDGLQAGLRIGVLEGGFPVQKRLFSGEPLKRFGEMGVEGVDGFFDEARQAYQAVGFRLGETSLTSTPGKGSFGDEKQIGYFKLREPQEALKIIDFFVT